MTQRPEIGGSDARTFELHERPEAQGLYEDLSPPALVRPGTALKIPVKLGGLNPGEDAKIVNSTDGIAWF